MLKPTKLTKNFTQEYTNNFSVVVVKKYAQNFRQYY